MKIGILSAFYPYRGGIAQFNASIYRNFEKQNHQVKAFTFSLQYPEFLFPGATQFVTENDKADRIDADRVLNTVNPFSYYTTYKKILKFQPDLVILRYWMPFFAPSLGTVAYLLRQKRIKTMAILDNITPHEKKIGDKILNNYFISNNDGFLVMGSSVEKDLLEIKPNAKYLFHPHPLYSHFGEKIEKQVARAKLQISNHKKVLLFFGLIRKYKGLDLVIETFNDLDEDYFLLIAGESYEDFSKYQEAIAKNKNKENISVNTAYILDDEVPKYFCAADVCVLPYKSATQSGIIAISYHFDLPVIVTDVGSLKEIVMPYQSGIVIDQPKTELIIKAINQYFEDGKPEFYQKNIQKFKEKYSWEGLTDQIVKFVSSV